MVRTDVAVGTPRLFSMFSTILAEAPRMACTSTSSATVGAEAGRIGCTAPSPAGRAGFSGTSTSGVFEVGLDAGAPSEADSGADGSAESESAETSAGSEGEGGAATNEASGS